MREIIRHKGGNAEQRQMSFWLCQLAGKSSFKGDRSTSQESGKGNFPSIGILQGLRKNLLVFERPFTTLRPDSAWSCTFIQQQKNQKGSERKAQQRDFTQANFTCSPRGQSGHQHRCYAEETRDWACSFLSAEAAGSAAGSAAGTGPVPARLALGIAPTR